MVSLDERVLVTLRSAVAPARPHCPTRVVREAGTDHLDTTTWLDQQREDDAEDIRLAAYRTAKRFDLDMDEFLEDFIELMRTYLTA